ncbi:bacterial Ig-like domain-containing protein [Lapidilactobacillus wuchangensis]|uniref:bacterial Ig-like domain-containing protein n=1 Tax=Lapidilactobacillus wuchangensis TaxID=2486001 RepID=UPI0013DE007A|nr:bacterial Ig-like domain-containing protein [Lapidilactobacillus wuchangensis]
MKKVSVVIGGWLIILAIFLVAMIEPTKVQAASVALNSQRQSVPATTNVDQWLPNKNLQQLVLYWLNRTATPKTGKVWQQVADIQKSDLQYLTEIDNYFDLPSTVDYRKLRNTDAPSGSTVYSLAGLQYATNLTNLTLQSGDLNSALTTTIRGDITDLTPIAHLQKLKLLNVAGNQISDITPIAQLPVLTDLRIGYNAIADFSSLNPAHYTNFLYNDQAVVLPVAYVGRTGERYQMDLNQLRLPGGKLAIPGLATGAGGAVKYSETTGRFYFKGGQDQLVDGQVVYTGLRPEHSPGFADGQYPMQLHVIQNPYFFYLNAVASEPGDAVPVYQVFQPYELLDDSAKVSVHDSVIYTTDTWQASDNFNASKSMDHAGQPLSLNQVTVVGTVDTTKPGKYQVFYRYGQQNVPATIEVKQSQQQLTVHDSTITVGDQWQQQDNFDEALDRDGNKLSFNKLDVSGTVATKRPGRYQIHYRYGNLEKVATVTVQAKKVISVTPQPAPKPEVPATNQTNNHQDNQIGSSKNNSTPHAQAGQQTRHQRTKAASRTQQTKNQSSLPQTGDRSELILLVLSILLLLLSGSGLTRTFKDKR